MWNDKHFLTLVRHFSVSLWEKPEHFPWSFSFYFYEFCWETVYLSWFWIILIAGAGFVRLYIFSWFATYNFHASGIWSIWGGKYCNFFKHIKNTLVSKSSCVFTNYQKGIEEFNRFLINIKNIHVCTMESMFKC